VWGLIAELQYATLCPPAAPDCHFLPSLPVPSPITSPIGLRCLRHPSCANLCPSGIFLTSVSPVTSTCFPLAFCCDTTLASDCFTPVAHSPECLRQCRNAQTGRKHPFCVLRCRMFVPSSCSAPPSCHIELSQFERICREWGGSCAGTVLYGQNLSADERRRRRIVHCPCTCRDHLGVLCRVPLCSARSCS
jgi:hypothetical protein